MVRWTSEVTQGSLDLVDKRLDLDPPQSCCEEGTESLWQLYRFVAWLAWLTHINSNVSSRFLRDFFGKPKKTVWPVFGWFRFRPRQAENLRSARHLGQQEISSDVSFIILKSESKNTDSHCLHVSLALLEVLSSELWRCWEGWIWTQVLWLTGACGSNVWGESVVLG